MKILVCGGRDYSVHDGLQLLRVYLEDQEVELVIHGGATGGDTVGKMWAIWKNVPQKVFLPDWDRYGKSAGPIRNKRMLFMSQPDLVIAFPGGQGTKNMLDLALQSNIPIVKLGEWNEHRENYGGTNWWC